MLLRILAGLSVAGATYFGCLWWASTRVHKTMTAIEKANAQIEEGDRRKGRRAAQRERLKNYLRDHGYEGDWTPILLVVTVAYVSIAVVMTVIGITNWIGAIVALPVTILAAVTALGVVRRKRQERFQVQLLQALGLMATQIEAGDGTKRALEKTVGLVEDPLRAEFSAALDSLVGSASLVVALKEVAERYPSRAMNLFIAALEIDDAVGTRLAPALRQAQATLERGFELAAEAKAEIASARYEFYALIAILGFIAFSLIGGSEGLAREAYFSGVGIIALGLTVGNAVFGFWRTTRIFRKVKGE